MRFLSNHGKRTQLVVSIFLGELILLILDTLPSISASTLFDFNVIITCKVIMRLIQFSIPEKASSISEQE